jgi:FtsH-binding integral membrane protein
VHILPCGGERVKILEGRPYLFFTPGIARIPSMPIKWDQLKYIVVMLISVVLALPVYLCFTQLAGMDSLSALVITAAMLVAMGLYCIGKLVHFL